MTEQPINFTGLGLSSLRRFIVALILISSGFSFSAWAQDRWRGLAGEGSVLLHSPQGEELVSYNTERALIPASIVKIPLAHVALSVLGEDYRFETHFYQNSEQDLLIRGLGDPFLVSEEVGQISQILRQQGLTQINRVYVDDSAFAANLDLPLEPGSEQPYAARNSALAVNFNTVNLAWSSAGIAESGEAQTPLTPIARALAARLSATQPQRINLGENPVNGLQQVQQLFHFFFESAGIVVADKGFYQDALTDDWSLLYAHRSSRALPEIVEGLLRYSNNFIANQLFLTLGTQGNNYPATVERARMVLRENLAALYGNNFGSDRELLLMLEGSGLSRAQRTTAKGMLQVLEKFKPYANLLPNINGALRKSGTLTGVYNFAGYIPSPEGLYPFVILTNQRLNNRAEILRLLQEQI